MILLLHRYMLFPAILQPSHYVYDLTILYCATALRKRNSATSVFPFSQHSESRNNTGMAMTLQNLNYCLLLEFP